MVAPTARLDDRTNYVYPHHSSRTGGLGGPPLHGFAALLFVILSEADIAQSKDL